MSNRFNKSSIGTWARISTAALPWLALLACGTAPADATGTAGEAVTAAASPMITPIADGVVTGTFPNEQPAAYQGGGKILAGATTIRPIFYGTAWQPNYQAKVVGFLQELSSTSYWSIIQEEYPDGAGNHATTISVDTPVNVTNYPLGKTLTKANIETLIQNDINAGAWPVAANYLYMVFTADDVNQGDFFSGGFLCQQFAGWHSAQTFSWTNLIPATITAQVPYAFVGSYQFCINSGLPGAPDAWSTSVNGDVTDTAIAVAEHETAEAVTDPFPFNGQFGWSPEAGDICAWVPGPLTTSGGKTSDLGGGEPYNSGQLGHAFNGGSQYLVQTLWSPRQKACAYGTTDLDVYTEPLVCGSWACGTATAANGQTFDCGDCANGQTCSSAHVCTGTVVSTCHTPMACCIQNEGVWRNGRCTYE